MKDLVVDLMASNDSHCLYHIGYSYKNSDSVLFLHKSSSFSEAADAFEVTLEEPRYVSYFFMYLILIKELLLKRRKIVILGINLRVIMFFIPLFIMNSSHLSIHLHGQIFALNKRGVKFHIWKFLAAFGVNLLVSNPAYEGPSFIKVIDNINDFKCFNINRIDDPFYKTKINSLNLEKRKSENRVLNYHDYVKLCKSEPSRELDFDDAYYAYSPSGRFSEAKMFDQTIIIRIKNYQLKPLAERVAKAYGVKYEVVQL